MKKTTYEEIKEIGKELMELKKKNPNKFYEYKGRIDALYEKAIEEKKIS